MQYNEKNTKFSKILIIKYLTIETINRYVLIVISYDE